MTIQILMPALSPTMEEGTLAKWMIKTGDAIKAGQVIAEIETDKATMEVEAVDEGVVSAILVPAGTAGVKVNAVIAEIVGEGAAPAPKAPAPFAAPAPLPAAAPAPAAMTAAPIQLPTPMAAAASGDRVKASPLAKRIAKSRGIDLSGLVGSGPNGRIILRDVENAKPGASPVRSPASAPAPALPAGGLIAPASLDQRIYSPDRFTVKPLDGMRRTVAKRLTESFMQVPHFPLTLDLVIDGLLAARARINAGAPEGVKVSVNDLLIKASAMALKAVPDANASYTDDGVILHRHADVAVAVAIEGGLITPVIFNAESKGLAAISAEMKDLAKRARDRKLKPQEYQGGTFSLSNLGMFGIKAFASIINQPQGMILSVGAGEERPIVKNGQLAVANVMTVTLTCDHRVVDGAIGAQWLAAFKTFVEAPETMLL